MVEITGITLKRRGCVRLSKWTCSLQSVVEHLTSLIGVHIVSVVFNHCSICSVMYILLAFSIQCCVLVIVLIILILTCFKSKIQIYWYCLVNVNCIFPVYTFSTMARVTISSLLMVIFRQRPIKRN